MTWFKVDDGLTDHPKVIALQEHKNWPRALALWTLAGAWSSKQLTNGRVPRAIVTRLGCSQDDAKLLALVGLWIIDGDGYAFHDWTRCNPTKESVEAKREKTKSKVTIWRRNQLCNRVTDDVTPDNGNQFGNPAPLPTSPVPTNSPLPPEGDRPVVSASAGQEVRDGWAAAWFEARAGTPPVLTGQNFAAAVEFARQVAKANGKPLGEAARAIAAHVIAHGKRGREDVFDMARMDPYAAAATNGTGESWEAYQARRAADPWAGIKQ
jgi:hypothetical protein